MGERIEQKHPNIEVWIEKWHDEFVVIRRQGEGEPVQVYKPNYPKDVGKVLRLLNNYVDDRTNLEFNPDLAKLKLGEIAESLDPINFSKN